MRSALPRSVVASGVLLAGFLVVFAATRADQVARPIYKDASRSVADRVNDLVSRMTLEEKVSQLMNQAAAIPRLDVPEYNWWNEALHGVARAGLATVFPQAIGLAATWDDALIGEMATTISDEARAKYHAFAAADKRGLYQGLTFWSPNINIFRDPRWGRGMETYGEDPLLAGRLAVAFVKGMQGDDPRYLKTIATPKHYAVHSGPESERHTFDAVIDERDLQDTYLAQFEMAVREGGALSVMCAYNRLAGEACCGSPRLLTDILRKQWGFQGYVVSDCGAIDDIYKTHKLVKTAAEASALAIRAGCDLECGDSFRSLGEAVTSGKLAERELDEPLRRLFTIRFRLGMFDPPDIVRWAHVPYTVVDSVAHRDQALRVARESIVLLKNDRQTLPLGPAARTIAVIGPNANDVEVLLGNYNGTPKDPVTVLEGIRRTAPAGTTVLFEQGSPLAEGVPALEVVPASALRTLDGTTRVNGLKGEYFDRASKPGAAAKDSWLSSTLDFPDFAGSPLFTRVDPVVDFNWWEGTPDARLANDDDFAIRWSGEIVPPVTGRYAIGASAMTGVRLFVDDKLVTQYKSRHEPSRQYGWVDLQAGRRYPIRLEYFQRMRDAHVSLLWQVPDSSLEQKAVAAARRADVAVLVLGLSPRLEGEEMTVPVPGFNGGDRTTLDLPAAQQHLLEAVHAVGKPVVLVLLNGSALGVTWADEHVPAIVEAWYPGQAAGTAVADVVFGRYNPAGRLPVTVYRSVAQLPAFNDYRMAGRTYRYFTGDPLYPFGHGLSYTSFGYRDLTASSGSAKVTVSVNVTNTGRRPGDEVVQAYLSRVNAPPESPVRSLKWFRRVTLAAGETRNLAFVLGERELAQLDASGTRRIEPGEYEIAVGGRQPGFAGRAAAATTGVATARFTLR